MTDYGISSTSLVPEDEGPSFFSGLLAALGIVEVIYSLNGGGDSGECELERVRYANGAEDAKLPAIPTGFRDDGEILLLDFALENIAAELPDGDWVNNEGGFGSVSFFPMETCAEDRIVCDMTFRDEDDYGDEDDEDFDELDPPENEAVDNGEMVLIAFGALREGAAR